MTATNMPLKSTSNTKAKTIFAEKLDHVLHGQVFG